MSEATASSDIAPGAGLLGMLSDDRLARRAVGGDERAFAAIFRRYHQSLYRFSLAIVGDPQDAQDVLQNTMVKVLRALPGEERPIELKPWLYRIAHNESIDLLRRRRETRELSAELPSRGPGLAEEAAARERLRRLLADLEELPERQRETLVMRELAGLDFAEIGAAIGTTAAVARQTVYEARLSLRQIDEGREMSCETVTRALSDGDGRVIRRRDIRAHLRACAACRRFSEEIKGRRKDFAALSPLPAVAAAGLLQGLLGSASGGGGGGLAAALGGGAAKSIGTSAALKGAATVAVVAAVGVTAADRGGLVDTPLPGGHGSSQATRTQGPEAGGPSSGTSGAEKAARLRAAKALDAAAGAGPAAKARVRGAAVGEVRGAGTTAGGDSSPGTPASAHGNGRASEHPHGRGHEKWHPSASGHGQQTVAAHQGGKQGAAGNTGASSPANPPNPGHPANQGGEKGSSASPPKVGATGPAEIGEQAAPVTPAPVEEDIAGPGQGRNP
jgi:RNA polymerase sigma factor (sigma-70 family)